MVSRSISNTIRSSACTGGCASISVRLAHALQKGTKSKNMIDINNLSDLTSRKSDKYSDVEIFEKKLAQGVYIAMLRGGFTAANPKLYMDNVVSEYVRDTMYNEFVEIFLDNPWIRVIIFGINNINEWRKFSENGTTE